MYLRISAFKRVLRVRVLRPAERAASLAGDAAGAGALVRAARAERRHAENACRYPGSCALVCARVLARAQQCVRAARKRVGERVVAGGRAVCALILTCASPAHANHTWAHRAGGASARILVCLHTRICLYVYFTYLRRLSKARRMPLYMHTYPHCACIRILTVHAYVSSPYMHTYPHCTCIPRCNCTVHAYVSSPYMHTYPHRTCIRILTVHAFLDAIALYMHTYPHRTCIRILTILAPIPMRMLTYPHRPGANVHVHAYIYSPACQAV